MYQLVFPFCQGMWNALTLLASRAGGAQIDDTTWWIGIETCIEHKDDVILVTSNILENVTAVNVLLAEHELAHRRASNPDRN